MSEPPSRSPRPWYLDTKPESPRQFAKLFREVFGYWRAGVASKGGAQGGVPTALIDQVAALRKDLEHLANAARRDGIISAEEQANLLGQDEERVMSALRGLFAKQGADDNANSEITGEAEEDQVRASQGPSVFISWAGAGDRNRARADDWRRSLRSAGFEVVDHGSFLGYDRILEDISRIDAMVAVVSRAAGTWARIEWTSAAEGHDTYDGLRGAWRPARVFVWYPEGSVTAEFLGIRADVLPEDFEAAVAHVIRSLA